MQFSSKTQKVLIILIISCFFYQFYDLTNDFLNYNHLIQLDIKPTKGFIPALSFCMNSFNILDKQGDFQFGCYLIDTLFGATNCFSYKSYIRYKNSE